MRNRRENIVSQHKMFSTVYFQEIFAFKLAAYNIYQLDLVVTIMYVKRAL